MDLHSALARVLKFTWNGKQNSHLKNVRFLPARGVGSKPMVYANRGTIGSMIQVDVDDLPNVMIDGDALVGLVKGNSTLTCSSLREVGNMKFWGDDGAQYTVTAQDPGPYPKIPSIPDVGEWWTSVDWWVVEQLLHAVSKDKQQAHLKCLHFGEGVIEATDRHRVARAYLDIPVTGLVPSEVFAKWPDVKSADVAIPSGSGENVAWFRMGDEMRMTLMYRESAFPDLEEPLPKSYDGPAVTVDVAEFTAALTKAVAVHDGVRLTFTPTETIGLQAKSFSATTPARTLRSGPVHPVSLNVNGKWVLSALKVCKTPRVLLGYGSLEPLRIESGAFSEGIWPISG